MTISFPTLSILSGGATSSRFLVIGYSPFIDVGIGANFQFGSSFGEGAILAARFSFSKYGGLQSFDLTVRRDITSPVWNGMHLAFYFDLESIACGYVLSTPPSDQTTPTMTISGVGLSNRLKEKIVSKAYTSKTIDYILGDLSSDFEELNIITNLAKIIPPNVTIASASWADKTIDQIILDLITISNYDFNGSQYIYGVDEVGEFYFYGISENSLLGGFFEGYNFQSPVIQSDISNIVNTVDMFRAISGDETNIEFVATYTDAGSIVEFGPRSRKVIIPDFVDTTSANNFALGIIENLKKTKYSETVQDLVVYEFLNPQYGELDFTDTVNRLIPFGFYSIINKKQTQMITLSDCTDLSQWDDSGITDSVLSIDQSRPYTGRACFLWEKNTGADDYIDLNFSPSITGPLKLRLFWRSVDTGTTAQDILTITLLNVQTNFEVLTMIDDSGNYIIDDSGNNITANVSATGTNTITISTRRHPNVWVPFEMDLSHVISFEGIRLTLRDSLYIDRLDLFADCYMSRAMSLETANYEITESAFKIKSCTFGQMPIELTEEIMAIGRVGAEYQNVTGKQ